MRNDIAQAVPELLTSAEDAADAVAQFGAALGVSQNTEVKIRADITSVVTARTNLEQGRVTRDLFYDELKQLASKANTFATLARDIFKPGLGRHYSPGWDITGFVGSLVVPTKAEELQPLLQSLNIFLGNSPDFEKGDSGITALEAGSLFDAISDCRSKIHAQETTIKNLAEVRDQAVLKLRRRIRGLIDELDQLIEPLDPRWLAFGFNMPGAEERPEVPLNVAAVLINNTDGSLTWDAPARAEYYRVFRKIIGVDQEFVAVGSPTDPNFTLEDLPANATTQVVVTAVNNGGESQFSEVVTVKTN